MQVKLLMQWDIKEKTEAQYYEFVVNEFIPRVKRLGMFNIQFWYTTFGECAQIQASGVAQSEEQMSNMLKSTEWDDIRSRLIDYVEGYGQKVIRVDGDFQL